MKKEEKKVPQLRFPKFKGDWEQRKLGEITTEKLSNGIMNHPSEEMTGVKHINVINMYTSDRIHIEDLTDSEYDDDAVKKCNVEIGDIFLTRSSVKPEGIAEANVLLDSGQYVYDDHLIRMKIDKCKYDAFFVKICLGTPLIKKQFIMKSKTTAFTTIGQDDIASCDCVFPSYGEQKAIGAFFDDLDHLITLHQRKLEKIRELKKGMLQKMFPKNGKKVPEIRFKGFTDDWEQRKLSDITLKIGSGKTPSGGKNAYVDDGIPLIRSQNINNDRVDLEDIVFIDEETDNSMENSRVFTDDVLLNITGASIGRSAVYRGKDKANVNQHVCIIRPTKDFDSDFIQLNLASNFGQKQIDASQAGGGREGLNFQEIGKMSFMFPSNQEQMKIGVYFNHIDYLITLHQRKLEKIKELKKGLLQQMFV